MSVSMRSCSRTDTYSGEQVHSVVQDHKFRAGLDAIDSTVQERCPAFHLHLPCDVVHLVTNLKEESRSDAFVGSNLGLFKRRHPILYYCYLQIWRTLLLL